jgi:hypothetical protein|tara:strand:+ start:54 stop:1934 length:1881 start_codon:yes stop_codon:yes gene_type:complete
MANYSNIKGFTVQTLSTDTIASQIAGGSWSSGANLPGARDECAGGGTLTAGIQFGGYSNPESAYKTETFEYDGTAWTEGGDMSSGRSNFGGAGTQTAALAIGGQSPGVPAGLTATEEYNGSSWTAGGVLPAGTNGNYGCTGTQSATLQIGGASPSRVATTLSYNGSSWSDTSNDLPVTIDRNGASGTTTAAITGGGREGSPGGYTNKFFTYNGSSWTAITTYPISASMISVQGPYTDVIAANGLVPPGSTNSNWWDGTSWTAAPSTSNYHGQCAHANSTAGATSGDGFIAGADPSSYNGTEHWNSAPSTFDQIQEGQLFFNSTTNTFKETVLDAATGTWATGGSLPVAQSYGGQTGTQTAGFIFGGSHTTPPSPQFQTESYDYNGTAWTDASADINTGRESAAASGTSTSALFFSGTSKVDLTESYDGSSWSETTELNTGRDNAFGFGQSSTAAVCAGGRASPSPDAVDLTEVWNGSAWTEVNEMNATKKYGGATGTTTAGAIAGGGDSGEGVPVTDQTELWNGTSWSEVAELNVGRDYAGGTGASTQFLFYGGINPPGGAAVANTEFYNGTSWTEIAEMGTAKMYMYSGSATGSATGGLATGASPPSTLTQEFTGALANKTITSG